MSEAALILSFGEIAAGLGLKGSTRTGWPCPACAGPHGVKEGPGHLLGTCFDCARVFDRVSYVGAVQSINADTALDRVLAIYAARRAPTLRRARP